MLNNSKNERKSPPIWPNSQETFRKWFSFETLWSYLIRRISDQVFLSLYFWIQTLNTRRWPSENWWRAYVFWYNEMATRRYRMKVTICSLCFSFQLFLLFRLDADIAFTWKIGVCFLRMQSNSLRWIMQWILVPFIYLPFFYRRVTWRISKKIVFIF